MTGTVELRDKLRRGAPPVQTSRHSLSAKTVI